MKIILISICLMMIVMLNTNAQTIHSNQTTPYRNPTLNFNFMEANASYKNTEYDKQSKVKISSSIKKADRAFMRDNFLDGLLKASGPIVFLVGVGTLVGTIIGTKHIAKNINDNNKNLKMASAATFGSVGSIAAIALGTTATIYITILPGKAR